MSILKETAISVPALAVLVFVSHAYFGSDDGQPISTPTSWLGAVTIPAERLILPAPGPGPVASPGPAASPACGPARRNPFRISGAATRGCVQGGSRC